MRNLQKNRSKRLSKLIKKLSLTMLAMQMTACATTQTTDFTVIYEHKQCAYADPGIIDLNTDKQQIQAVNKLLPFNDEADKIRLKELLHTQQVKDRVFLVSQGSKPTPGYGFEIFDNKALLNGSTLRLPVRFTRPEQGKMMAQVITSPCLIFGVDKSTHFKRIEVDALHLDIKQSN